MANRRVRVAMVAFAQNYHTQRWSRALTKAGFEVHLVATFENEAADVCDGVVAQPVQMPDAGVPLWTAARAWHDALCRAAPDVVYMQWLFARPAMLLALEPAWPLVVTVMGSDVCQDRSRPESTLERIWRTAILRRAQTITVAAPPLGEVVATYHPSLRARIRLLPFGVDCDQFCPPPTPMPRAAGAPLQIGHFKSGDPVYCRLEMLQALALLLAAGRRVHLHVAGSQGRDLADVRAFASQHPEIEPHVTDHGRVDVDAMPDLYRRLDVYVMNSRVESFGVAAAEALATEVPVVATDVGGLPAIVRPGDTGLVVPANDVTALANAITELDDYPALRRTLGSRGRRRVCERFPWQDSIEGISAMLHDAARKGT
jgi:glycosyltransferase involved in cell wall biosynthesis